MDAVPDLEPDVLAVAPTQAPQPRAFAGGEIRFACEGAQVVVSHQTPTPTPTPPPPPPYQSA